MSNYEKKPQTQAAIVIDHLKMMIESSKEVQEAMPVEVQTAAMMRHDQAMLEAAIKLLRDAYRVTKH